MAGNPWRRAPSRRIILADLVKNKLESDAPRAIASGFFEANTADAGTTRMIPLSGKLYTQPQTPVGIDWSNPLTRGLILANNLGVGFVNSVTNETGINYGTTSSVNRSGRGRSFADPNYIGIPVNQYSPPVGNYTYIVIAENFSNSGIKTLISAWDNSTTGRNVYFALNAGTLQWDIPYKQSLCGVPAPSPGIHIYALCFTNGGNALTYVDGILVKTTAITATLESPTVPFQIGRNNTNTDNFVGNITKVSAWNRALSNAEIKSLSDNPWQIFKSQSRRIFVASAGGDTPVNPGVGTIAITGYAPSIAQTANQAVAPGVGNIVITGYAPTISQPQAVNPGVGSLVITGYAPTVTQNVDVPVNPGVGTIAITGYAPTVAQTANQSVLPATGTIAITGYSPAVSQSANQAVTPDVGTITITGYAPIVQQAPASQNITPGVGTITITGYAPTVEQSSPLRLGGFEYGSKVYIKRNKKIYIFDSVEEADSYLEAEAKAEEIVQQSAKTSRLARKRAREKAHKLLSIEPVESVDIPALKTLVSQLQTDFELPQWIAQQDWQRVVEIYNQAMEMQDEEDLLLIL